MSDYIKKILSTAGWQEIEALIDKKILECKTAEIDEETDANEYKVIDLANRKTARALKELLVKIKTSGGLEDKPKISYI